MKLAQLELRYAPDRNFGLTTVLSKSSFEFFTREKRPRDQGDCETSVGLHNGRGVKDGQQGLVYILVDTEP